MAKKSMTPSERREAILKVLCQRRQDKIDNLAFEFGVSVRTIKNDIEELSLAYPIETVRGRYGGGVKVADGYYVGRNYLRKPVRLYDTDFNPVNVRTIPVDERADARYKGIIRNLKVLK